MLAGLGMRTMLFEGGHGIELGLWLGMEERKGMRGGGRLMLDGREVDWLRMGIVVIVLTMVGGSGRLCR